MLIHTEQEMLDFGRNFATRLQLPAVLELVGDVGTGKTTFTRGLAEGLGVREPVTSPSFTISKRYAFPLGNPADTPISPNAPTDTSASPDDAPAAELVHYDFYRLPDPGLMRDELAETLANPNTVVVVEWGGDVANLLPSHKIRLDLTLLADGSREVTITEPNPSTPPSSSSTTLEPQTPNQKDPSL